MHPDRPARIELGDPKMKPLTILESKRYNADPSAQASFKKGAIVYCTPKAIGMGGEEYSRFYKTENSRQTAAAPEIRIVDARDKEIVSEVMEPG